MKQSPLIDDLEKSTHGLWAVFKQNSTVEFCVKASTLYKHFNFELQRHRVRISATNKTNAHEPLVRNTKNFIFRDK